MYKIIIFPSKTIANEMLLTIGATIDPVWVYFDPSKTYEEINQETGLIETKNYPNKIQYNVASDGRCAIAHNWQDDDLEWIANFWEDDEAETGFLNNVLFLDNLPEGW
jgi:hypothetical protein